MNLQKHLEFFNPEKVKDDIHIIGCGALGSTIATMLARLGCTNLNLYDFDTVAPENIANQVYYTKQINEPKVEALAEILHNINEDAIITLHPKGWVPEIALSGYVFLAPDQIQVRQKVVKSCINNHYLKGLFDFRMRLSDAQHYAAEYDPEFTAFKNLLKTMNFTQDEAQAATPVSACGTTLSVIPTINTIVSLGIANFINLIKENMKDFKHIILIDTFKADIDAL